ncbi:ABC transporter ATP-binding protein [Cellulomonas sp. KRMCY2]|uniref:ABC transporter ATP-binding protein n=1 Tax=Cellulomonas sp. KRMCY2 TaxID=1304865 RepID=UPI0004A4139A|nr:ABC transporter ATP-binding protein [Cellulomonas sp. KRMCY2]
MTRTGTVAPPVVQVEHLRKTYGTKVAVDDVSLTVEKGEIVGILGPNGAGKTTTVEMIAGLRVPDAGDVRVLGLDPQRDGPALRERLGLQLQESEMPAKITVQEALDLYASFYAKPADPADLIRDLGLTDRRDTQFRRLSGGQKQRLSVALALVGNPEVAILDELTTGLDPQARRETWGVIERIRDRGVTILLVTHYMEEAERLADRVLLIDAGRVVAEGTPAQLAARTTAQTVRFTVREALPAGLLERLPGVAAVTVSGTDYEVRGAEMAVDVVLAVTGAGLRPQHLRVEQGSLEEAFVSIVTAGAAGREA